MVNLEMYNSEEINKLSRLTQCYIRASQPYKEKDHIGTLNTIKELLELKAIINNVYTTIKESYIHYFPESTKNRKPRTIQEVKALMKYTIGKMRVIPHWTYENAPDGKI